MTTTRYELRDSHHEDWGAAGRFNGPTGEARGRKALAEAVPPGRFYLVKVEGRKRTRVAG